MFSYSTWGKPTQSGPARIKRCIISTFRAVLLMPQCFLLKQEVPPTLLVTPKGAQEHVRRHMWSMELLGLQYSKLLWMPSENGQISLPKAAGWTQGPDSVQTGQTLSCRNRKGPNTNCWKNTIVWNIIETKKKKSQAVKLLTMKSSLMQNLTLCLWVVANDHVTAAPLTLSLTRTS